jgi:hypothetical protein
MHSLTLFPRSFSTKKKIVSSIIRIWVKQGNEVVLFPYMYSLGVVGYSITNPLSLIDLLQLHAREIIVIFLHIIYQGGLGSFAHESPFSTPH